ncbi:MAG TPA: 3-dehydroquinate synthase [Crocinitomix sp.]|nr:3-dehydroquinate synthase [Crocinitomix sp.]
MVKKINHFNSKLLFGNQLNFDLDAILEKEYNDCKIAIITDENVYNLWFEDLITSTTLLHNAEVIQLPSGEDTKGIEICYQVWETLAEYKFNRGDLIINFGGGVITDFGGFVASTFKRGVQFINIPTTLLAQVDASIGGKTGVNLGDKKNLIGSFSNANYVFIDYKYLNTLNEVELKSGFAEMLKHGLINDKKHWHNLIKLKNFSVNGISSFIYDSVLIKHQIVKADPFEKDIRKSLNFGHTFGHAYEGLFLNKQVIIPHGYAVALGMIFETYLSYKLKYIEVNIYKEIYNSISFIYDFTPITDNDIDTLLLLMKYDKKNTNSFYNFTLLTDIGTYKINCLIDVDTVNESLEEFIGYFFESK